MAAEPGDASSTGSSPPGSAAALPMPVAKIVKSGAFDAASYEPHPNQWEIHKSRARHRVVSCGRRFGKSLAGGMELVPPAFAAHAEKERLREAGMRREYWIVGPQYSDSAKEFRALYDALKRLGFPFDRPGTYNDEHGGDMQISLWDGLYIVIAKSAMHPDRLVGEGLSGVILAEAAKMKPSIWLKFIRPALADYRGWSLATSTPEGRNWFYERWQDGQDPSKPAWASWRFPSWTNPFVFPEGRYDPEIAEMSADMSEERFNQEIGADFTEFVGRVFKDFDEEYHVTDLDYNPKLPVYLAADYGYTNPFVALAIQEDTWGNIYILREYRALHRDINDIGRDLKADSLFSKARFLYPDPAQPGDSEVLKKILKVRSTQSTGGELRHRLEYIRRALKFYPEHAPTEHQQPGMMIDRRCHGLIYEMNEYRYPSTKLETIGESPENPLKENDHGPEALGRFFRGHYGPLASEQEGREARVSRAKVG